MKKIEIEIPDGKNAKWINGVLTLIDESKENKADNIMDRVKSFEDACKEVILNGRGELADEYKVTKQVVEGNTINNTIIGCGLLEYMQLRIIAEALNEGHLEFDNIGDRVYFPVFKLYTRKNYNEIALDGSIVKWYLQDPFKDNDVWVVFDSVSSEYLGDKAFVCSALTFKSEELARYAGTKFIDIWSNYITQHYVY